MYVVWDTVISEDGHSPGEGASLGLQVHAETLLDLLQLRIALPQFVSQARIRAQLNHLEIKTEASMSFSSKITSGTPLR